MRITGKYEADENFTTIYSNNTVYTIAKNGDWGSVKVGQQTNMGVLSQDTYDEWVSKCTKEGTFELD